MSDRHEEPNSGRISLFSPEAHANSGFFSFRSVDADDHQFAAAPHRRLSRQRLKRKASHTMMSYIGGLAGRDSQMKAHAEDTVLSHFNESALLINEKLKHILGVHVKRVDPSMLFFKVS
jgi:hypothetical protein